MRVISCTSYYGTGSSAVTNLFSEFANVPTVGASGAVFGVLLAFGDYSTDTPNCASVSFTSDNWYGSDNAAFKPEYKGSTIFYGGEVKSVSQVNTAGMQELKFPNGKVYMYK